MKVLLTHPFCWPYVRRGGERFLEELAGYLASEGHDVTVLTSKPGERESVQRNGVQFLIERQLPIGILRLLISPETSFSIRCFQTVRRNRFDVIHCLHYADALGVGLAGLFQSTPFFVHVTFLPVAFRRRILENVILRYAMRRATEVIAVSTLASFLTEKWFHRSAKTMAVPCNIDRFLLCRDRDLTRPVILASGAFSDPRKGARVLMRAFEAIKRPVPNARLQYSGAMAADIQEQLLAEVNPSVWPDIEFLGVGTADQLPRLYGSAAVTVLPSINEGLGMVLIESLACGTPVVGSADGGMADIVVEGVGELFDPQSNGIEPTNVDGLADAILKTLSLHSDPELPLRCRAHAEKFSWSRLGPGLVGLYRSAVSRNLGNSE